MVTPWKTYQSKVKLQAKIRRYFLMGLVVITLIIGYLTTKVVQWFRRPVGELFLSEMNRSVLTENQQVNFFLSGQNLDQQELCWLAVGTLDQRDQSLSVITVPLTTKIQTRDGLYSLSQLPQVGEALNPPQQVSYLTQTLERYLAIPFDGLVIWQDSCPKDFSLDNWLLEKHREWQLPTYIFNVVRNYLRSEQHLTSTFSRSQLWRLIKEFKRFREDKLSFYLLSQAVDEQDPELRDEFVKSVFSDELVEDENWKLRIRNGTTSEGLASGVARFVENLGAKVLMVDNYETLDVTRTRLIVYNGKKEGWTLERIKQLLRVTDVGFRDEVSRTDLEIILGTDWVDRSLK